MDKRFLSILGALTVIFIGIFIVSQHSSNNSGTDSNGAQPTNNIEGKGAKGVTLIEYGDYQCPVCGKFYQPLKQVFAANSQDIYFQFRNLPLVSIHKNAFSGARAAEAAGMQNKYWQMHDKLYDNQDPTGKTGWVGSSDPLSFFATFAQQIGLNVNQFKTDYASSKVNDAINADLEAFKKTGQEQATPAFFLEGKALDSTQLLDPQTGAVSVAKFNQLIAAEIAAKNK